MKFFRVKHHLHFFARYFGTPCINIYIRNSRLPSWLDGDLIRYVRAKEVAWNYRLYKTEFSCSILFWRLPLFHLYGKLLECAPFLKRVIVVCFGFIGQFHYCVTFLYYELNMSEWIFLFFTRVSRSSGRHLV